MIEALIISIDEPQAVDCLESANKQTIPFSNIIHVNNDVTITYTGAYNRGISLLKGDWFLNLNGDICLYPDAVEKCIKALEGCNDDKVVGHLFEFYDTFLEMRSSGMGLFRTDVIKSYPMRERLCGDVQQGRELFKGGWGLKRQPSVLGMHFNYPDEFQVFRRFYVSGLKYNHTALLAMTLNLQKLYQKTDNPLYEIALEAMQFAGKKNGLYPGAHDINFDRKMYEEFNALQKTFACT